MKMSLDGLAFVPTVLVVMLVMVLAVAEGRRIWVTASGTGTALLVGEEKGSKRILRREALTLLAREAPRRAVVGTTPLALRTEEVGLWGWEVVALRLAAWLRAAKAEAWVEVVMGMALATFLMPLAFVGLEGGRAAEERREEEEEATEEAPGLCMEGRGLEVMEEEEEGGSDWRREDGCGEGRLVAEELSGSD